MQRALAWIAALAICVLATMPARAAQLAYVAIPAAPKADPAVAIEPIARKLGWTFARTADGATLDDGDGPLTLRIGSRLVREDGADVALFASPAVDHNGQVALTITDAATLFNLSVERDGDRVALVAQPANDVDIREVPRPATPAPVPTATPRRVAYSTPALVQGTAGTLALSVEFDGNNRIYQTNLSGNAGAVHGNVSSYGSAAVTNPVGTVTVGAPARNIGFGAIENPLAGSVINNGSLTGVTAHVATGGDASYDLSSGSTINGNITAFTRSSATTVDALALISGDGAFDQALLRHAVISTEAWGTIDYEAIVGEHGVAEGLHARTKGKTFLDANLSDASGALPLIDGDLPSGAVIGEHLSAVTTVTAGYVRAIGAAGSPTLGVTTRVMGLTLGANISEHWTNLTASYTGPGAYASLFTSSGISQVFGLNGSLALHRWTADLSATSSGGTSSGLAQLRTNHAGLNVAAGLDLNFGTIRPLVGIVVPIAPALAFEAGLVPGPSGRPALRLSVLAGFRQPKPRVAQFPVTVFVPDATHFGPLRVFVDGVCAAKPLAAGTPIMVPAGKHTVYVESGDHNYASPARDVVAGDVAKLDLTLFPQHTIAGQVSFGGPAAAVPAGASLQGIRVVLEPGGESTTTDADGRFIFARAPYAPNSSILLDPSTVTSGFSAPGAQPAEGGSAEILLEPRRKVEHTSFN
jgi:hypothetical protein